jgi:adenine-specific DNA methylase
MSTLSDIIIELIDIHIKYESMSFEDVRLIENRVKKAAEEIKIQINDAIDNSVIKDNKIMCPKCGREIWDIATDCTLNKCWGCGLAFDYFDNTEDEE